MLINNREQSQTDDETSILLNKNEGARSEDEETLNPDSISTMQKYFNRYFLLEIFAWANYVLAILNILFNAVVYFNIYRPVLYQRFCVECSDQVGMSVFLDNFLSIATIIFFSYILRYLKKVR